MGTHQPRRPWVLVAAVNHWRAEAFIHSAFFNRMNSGSSWIQTSDKNRWAIYIVLALAYIALLALSPAEATLGDVVKLVYAHGAAERIATYAYLIAALLGAAFLTLKREALARWSQSTAEVAIFLWLFQFILSVPAQIFAWGAFTLSEPRVAAALWILGMTTLVYTIARWVGGATWVAFSAMANALIFVIVLRGAVNILHPFDPIMGSDSATIKLFYAAIVIVTGTLAWALARERAAHLG
jgi:hypothetical protein